MPKPVLLIRPSGNESDAAALAELGIASLIDPYLEISASAEQSEAIELLNFLTQSHGIVWLIATSVNSIKYWAQIVGVEKLTYALGQKKDLHYAAIGEATANALKELGAHQILIPEQANSVSLATALLDFPPGIAAIPGGNLAMAELPRQLRAAEWSVKTAVVYRTSPVAKEPESIQLVASGQVAAVLLRSPSAAQAFLARIPAPELPIVCAGTTTANAVAELGIKVGAVAKDPSPTAVASTIAALLQRQDS